MKKPPLVSVVMSCYNSQETIKESVESILRQTVSDFEFIIIDDGSTDETRNIITSYNDDRINLICNDVNKGLGSNLNYGLNLSKGEYIARMDSDDISIPSRFEMQIRFLRSHPNTICVGSRAIRFGAIPLKARLFHRVMKQALSYEDIKVQMLNGTPILHPSVMFNGELLRKSGLNYDPKFRRAQDYELWSRMIWDYRIENMKECLLKYRYSSSQASYKYRKEQISRSSLMYRRVLEKLFNREITESELEVHSMFSTRSSFNSKEFSIVSQWMDKLHDAVVVSPIFSELSFNKYMSCRWAVICRDSFNNRHCRIEAYNNKSYLSSFNIENFIRLMV